MALELPKLSGADDMPKSRQMYRRNIVEHGDRHKLKVDACCC
jgi:hypothetical protein